MADVTGKTYERFTAFLLSRIGWAQGPGSGENKEFLWGKNIPARCYTSTSICAHAEACSVFSKKQKLPYGPWNDPDFFLIESSDPFGCIHVTHWSNPRASQLKFWRSIEDHFQCKTFFGHRFLSINFVFEALDEDAPPRLLQDSHELVRIHGWNPATGSMHATSYDASILFPLRYTPIQAFIASLPTPMPKLSTAKQREFYTDVWDTLCNSDHQVRDQIYECVELLGEALQFDPNPRWTPAIVRQLQKVCFRGRQMVPGSRTTFSRYRKGIQHAFIIRELIGAYWGDDLVDPDEALWRILTTTSRFPTSNFRSLFGLSDQTTDAELTVWGDLLSKVPLRMIQRVPVPLLDTTTGIGEMVAWDPDTSTFIQSVRGLTKEDLEALRRHIEALFKEYREAYGMASVIKDLASPSRVEDKIKFVRERFMGLELDNFIEALVPEMLSPYNTPSHQQVATDSHNWPLDVLIVLFDLGSMQHITTSLPPLFEKIQQESMRHYAFMADTGRLISHLIAGVPVGQFFSNKCELDEEAFYETIWPLFAECLWHAFQGIEPLPFEKACEKYRHKKALRIISSPDLEPIKFLFQSSLPELESGPVLRGVFNQLSSRRNWGKSAFSTEFSGSDPKSKAVIQTQAVFEGHYSDKVKEISSRIRSLHLELSEDETFVPKYNPDIHYLVIDGDWPFESKINLYEAGFSGIFEIGELEQVSAALEQLEVKK